MSSALVQRREISSLFAEFKLPQPDLLGLD